MAKLGGQIVLLCVSEVWTSLFCLLQKSKAWTWQKSSPYIRGNVEENFLKIGYKTMKMKLNKKMKKILLALFGAVVVLSGVAAMSAFEAHIINVTAHIENALRVSARELDFGTVFPQEYLEREVAVELSSSFLAEQTADDVRYVINQKPKCWNNSPSAPLYAPVNYWNDECPGDFIKMESLCGYLCKTDGDPDDQNDIGVPSYYQQGSCAPLNPQAYAVGYLAKSQGDASDRWIVDLKVPPVAGYVGQDWPADCPTVPTNEIDYGCDLWVEVTGISRIESLGEFTASVALENKDSNWNVINDQTFGTLVYVTQGPTFNFNVTAQGLQPSTEYDLIYYADPWAGNHPGALIGVAISNPSGQLVMAGNPDLGMDLPDPGDANYPGGAKVWLVPSSDYNEATYSMTGWNPTQYLFEYNTILYNDTDTP